MDKRVGEIKVWDPVVRLFHWSLVLFFAIAWMTEDEWLPLHVLAGYMVLGLVSFRILWGLVGTRHARFSDFTYPPRRVAGYLKALLALKARRYLGHGPAGGTMVVVLIVSLLLTGVSGLAVYGGQEYEGPLAGFMASRSDLWSEIAEAIHEFFAGFTALLVLIHIAGVLFSSLVHRENLIGAMVTGYKRVKEAPGPPSRSAARASSGVGPKEFEKMSEAT